MVPRERPQHKAAIGARDFVHQAHDVKFDRPTLFFGFSRGLGSEELQKGGMTAEATFAFETAVGTLRAGTYQFTSIAVRAGQPVMLAYNTKTRARNSIGLPMLDSYHPADERGPRVEFLCAAGVCSLKAIRTIGGATVYNTPRKQAGHKEDEVALVSVPIRLSNGD
jgi:hypothetical protein